MSSLTLSNNTPYIAMFTALKGGLVIARIPGIAPGAQLQIPTVDTYQVTASTILEGNTYLSATMDIDGATSFLAQVLQVPAQGTYEFNVVQSPSTRSDQLQFLKTTLNPVTFSIARDGVTVQNVVVPDSFQMETLAIDDTFHVYAVINGITTATVTTTNPYAVITAVVDTSELEEGYFTLEVS